MTDFSLITKLGVAITLHTFNRDVLGGTSEGMKATWIGFFCHFPQSLQTMLRVIPRLVLDLFLANPFQLIVTQRFDTTV
jgi:hypothetical protein